MPKNDPAQNLDDEKIQTILNTYKSKIEAAKKEKFTFLLVGRTGVGKSSSVNSLMDKQVAAVGDYMPTTMSIESFDNEAFGIKFVVIDTPGLCDDLEEEGKDEVYLELIRAQVPKVDCLWFITRLDDTRVSSDEKRAIRLIPAGCGKDVWEHAIIVFTFANSVSSDKFREAYEKRTQLIRLEIARWTNSSIAAKVPSVAIDNKSITTPDGQPWLGELYITVFSRVSEHGFLPFLLATAERLVLPPRPVSSSPSNVPAPDKGKRRRHRHRRDSDQSYQRPHVSEPQYDFQYKSDQVYSPSITVSYPPLTGSSSEGVSSDQGSKGTGTSPIVLNPRQAADVGERIKEDLMSSVLEGAGTGAVTGASIGIAVGGPIGAAVGGAVGAVIGGAIGWLFGKST